MILPELQHLATPIDELKPLPGNPRKGDVEAVAKSYERFGQRKPIVVTEDGTVIAGNHQLLAAKKLGWTEIAVVRVEDDEQTAKAFALADNRTADLGSYDDTLLAELLADVSSDLDLLAATGYTEQDLDDLIASIEPEQMSIAEPDAIPDKAPAKTVRGDVWLLGSHRLMCGDSTIPTDVAKLMQDTAPILIFSDPPYGIKHSGNGITAPTRSGRIVEGNRFGEIIGDGSTETAKDAFTFLYYEYPNSTHVWWGANYYPSIFPDNHGWIIWDKERVGDLFSDGEIAFLNKGVRVQIFRHLWHGIAKASETGQKRIHPTQKPVALVIWTFDLLDEQGIIFDPFAGSGTTLIAAQRTGRTCYTMELDEHYCDIICARFQKATGIKPIAESTGQEHDFLVES